MQDLRSALLDRGFSAVAVEKMLRRWSPGMRRSYNAPWRYWFDFCQRSRICPFYADGPHLTNFLAEQSSLGRAGGTINGYTSAIVTAQGLVTGRRELARLPEVASVKAGARRDKPTQPRHEEVWDPAVVLTYWRGNPPSTVREKRSRAISLLMLAIFCRPSDLAKFSTDHTVLSGTELRYRIRGPKEAKDPHYLTPVQVIPMMADNDSEVDVCVARALLSYWDSISDRTRDTSSGRGIFWSLKPSKGTSMLSPIGAECFSNLMREVMISAGVDPSFTGGSARAVGSTAALESGMDFTSVMTRGRWSSQWVFNKFYKRTRLMYMDARARAAPARRSRLRPAEQIVSASEESASESASAE